MEKECNCIIVILQFKRAYCLVLTIFIVIKMIMISIFQTVFGYIKAVILGLQLKGPRARFLLGNVSILLDINSKSTIKFT